MRTAALALLLAVVAAPAGAMGYVDPLKTHQFDIQRQPMRACLQELADVTNLFIVTSGSRDLLTTCNEVKGAMTYDQALSRMLVGTGLVYLSDSMGRVTIVPRAALQSYRMQRPSPSHPRQPRRAPPREPTLLHVSG